jgi:hypothetical protein
MNPLPIKEVVIENQCTIDPLDAPRLEEFREELCGVVNILTLESVASQAGVAPSAKDQISIQNALVADLALA